MEYDKDQHLRLAHQRQNEAYAWFRDTNDPRAATALYQASNDCLAIAHVDLVQVEENFKKAAETEAESQAELAVEIEKKKKKTSEQWIFSLHIVSP